MNRYKLVIAVLLLVLVRPLAAQQATPQAALSPMELVDQGVALAAEGQYAEAIDSFNQALEIDPNFAPANYGLAEAYHRQNEYELAVENYTRAIEAPNGFSFFLPVYLARGHAYASLGQSEAAAADWWRWTTQQMEFVDMPAASLLFGDFVSVEMKDKLAFRIPFEGQVGQAISVQADALEDADVDPLMLIVNADGEALAADDDSGEDDNAAIEEFILPETGEYSLVITHAAGGSEGFVKVTHNLTDAPSLSSDGTPESSTAVCTVRTDQPQSATVRVGPGENRSTILFLPANQDFPVVGQAFADDDSLWWRLDKEAVAPTSGASELWVAQDQVTSTGNCVQVGQVEAPPIVPIAVQPSTPIPGTSSTDDLITPNAGTWSVSYSENVTISCPNGENHQLPTFAVTGPTAIFNVSASAADISINGRTLTRVLGTNTFEGPVTFFLGTGAQVSVTFTSPTGGTASGVMDVNFNKIPCQGTFTFSMQL